jgi:hypothetical protein
VASALEGLIREAEAECVKYIITIYSSTLSLV